MSDGSHHHRSAFAEKQKAHKTKGKSQASSKNKVAGRVVPGVRRSDPQSKHISQFHDIGHEQRRAAARERRHQHREKTIQQQHRFYGRVRGGVPKIVAMIPLSPHVNPQSIKHRMALHCDTKSKVNGPIPLTNKHGNQVSNFLLWCPPRDALAVLDIVKVADIVLFVAGTNPQDSFTLRQQQKGRDRSMRTLEASDDILGIDDKGRLFVSLVRKIGVPHLMGLYQLTDEVDTPRRKDKSKKPGRQVQPRPLNKHAANAMRRYLSHEFAKKDKELHVFRDDDMPQIFRFMNEFKHVDIEWRERRPHILAEEVDYQRNPSGDGGQLRVVGYLRGTNEFNIQRPVHITGVGDFHVSQVDPAPAPYHEPQTKSFDLPSERRAARKEERRRQHAMNSTAEVASFLEEDIPIADVDIEDTKEDASFDGPLLVPTEEQDSLEAVLPLDPFATVNDQSLITEDELKEIERERRKNQNYLDAWNERVDWGSDHEIEDGKEEDLVGYDDEVRDLIAETSALALEEKDMEDPVQLLAAKKKLEREEQEWPDEVDTPLNIDARKHFAKYRGLKSFLKTKWDKFESLPLEYSRIFQIRDWKAACKAAERNEVNVETVKCGQRVCLYIENVPALHASAWKNLNQRPILIWNLLEHEHRVSVCHFLVKKSVDYHEPVQGLDSYIFDVGFRRFSAQPIFSEHSRNDKHFVKKFLGDTEHQVATVYSPITYPNMPVIMLEDPKSIVSRSRRAQLDSDEEGDDEDIEMEQTNEEKPKSNWPVVATGSLLEVNAHRLVIKQKILTGHAIRVHRRRAVVRYMFWNAHDVRYFKPLDLWTKHGLQGRIEEPIGEKGYMKCFFNGNIQQHDVVCMSLYKRVYPVPDEELFQMES